MRGTINEIIQGNAAITAETALQLEQVLGIPASFWLKGEQRYREYLARLAEEQRLKGWSEWLKEIPVREMMRRCWIPSGSNKSQQVLEVLKFFSVASPDAWRTIWEQKVIVYRKSTRSIGMFGAITAWLRREEMEAQEIDCAPSNADTFRDALKRLRALTVEPINLVREEMIHVCAEAGVAVVFVQELPKTSISGSTQWLTSSKALVQLSFRYKTEDQLWFIFFHEAGHILLHGKKQVFLEIERGDRKEAENEADTFASNTLIDLVQWRRFIAQASYRTKVGIKEFAQKVGVAPGIVVGRLQHEKLLPFDHCNELKWSLEWTTRE